MKKKTMTLLFIIYLMMILFTVSAFAQVSVTATQGTATGSYNTLNNAVAAIGNGTHKGRITVMITADLTISASISFPVSGLGSASYSSITIRPSGGARRTLSCSTNVVFWAYSTDSLIFDGIARNGDTLEIVHNYNDPGYVANIFRLQSNACKKVFRNLRLKSGINCRAFTINTSSGGSHNLFRNIDFLPVNDSLQPELHFESFSVSSATVAASNNIIDSCRFGNFSRVGLQINNQGPDSGWLIRDNHFFSTLHKNSTYGKTCISYRTGNGPGQAVISGNYFGGSAPFCAGNAWQAKDANAIFTAISCGSTQPVIIENNRISNIFISSSTMSFRGIEASGGYVSIRNNVIGHESNAASIRLNGFYFPNALITCEGANPLRSDIYNNILAGVLFTASSGSNQTELIHFGWGDVYRNRIWNINKSFASLTLHLFAFAFKGNGTNTSKVFNNQVCLKVDSVLTGNLFIFSEIGAVINGTRTLKIYHNNFVMQKGIYHQGVVTSVLNLGIQYTNYFLYNNILVNAHTNGNANVLSGQITGSNWKSDYNFMAAGIISKTFRHAGNASCDLETWVANGRERNSWNMPVGNGTDSLNLSKFFTNMAAGDLSVIAGNPEAWYINGKAIRGAAVDSLTSDYASNNVRGVKAGVCNDIGAFEVAPISTPVPMKAKGQHWVNGTESLWLGGRKMATILWGSSGTLPAFSNLFFYANVPPNDTTNGGTTNGKKFMNCYWKIDATGGSNFSYSVTLHYIEGLLGTVSDESSLRLCKKSSTANGTWGASINNTILDTVVNSMQVNSLNSFSEFSGTAAQAPLPVHWLSFTAEKKETGVLLEWSSAWEVNNSHFEVERSADGVHWELIGTQSGHGTTSNMQQYSFTDQHALQSGKSILYYRLRQEDFNGASEYSRLRMIRTDDESSTALIFDVYPNPGNGIIHIKGIEADKPVKIKLSNMQGMIVFTGEYDQGPALNLEHLQNGCYLVEIMQNEISTARRLIINR